MKTSVFTDKSRHEQKQLASFAFLVVYVLLMLGVFWFLLNHSVNHQVKPNFKYQINDSGQWVVVDDAHPTLKRDNKVVALSIAGKQQVLDKNWLWPTVFNLSDYPQYQQILEHEAYLFKATWTMLAQPNSAYKGSAQSHTSPLQLIDKNGKAHDVAFKKLTLSDITPYVWFQYGIGGFIFLVGLLTAGIKPMSLDKLIILLSASCLAVAVFSAVATLDRVWAVDPEIIHYRFALGNICLKAYFFSLVVMLWRLPQKLPYSKPISLFWLGGFGVYLLATWLIYFFGQHPSHMLNIAAPLFFVSVFCFYLVYRQWKLSKVPEYFKLSHVIALRWMIIIIIVCGIVAFGFNVLWQLGLAESRYGSIINSFNGGIYLIGFAGLIYSGSLYKVEVWWWQIWGVFSGLSVVLLATMFLGETVVGYSVLNILLSLILGLVTYFTVTGYFRFRYTRHQAQLLEAVVPSLVHISSAQSHNGEADMVWQDILTKVFSPKSIHSVSFKEALQILSESGKTLASAPQCNTDMLGAVCHEGDTMLVRGFNCNMLALQFSAQGLRLFTKLDLKRAKLLWEVVWQAYQASVAYKHGEVAERKRIACDLHDDIGGKLLHLSSQEGEYGDYARRTLEDLRTLTHGLSSDNKTFVTMVADLRYQLRNQCDAQGLELHFAMSLPEDDEPVTSKSSVNFYCIINELARNAMQHTGVENLWIDIQATLFEVTVLVVNDGNITNPSHWQSGLGMVSIRRRVTQFDGQITWYAREGGGAVCRMSFPYDNLISDVASPSMSDFLALNENYA